MEYSSQLKTRSETVSVANKEVKNRDSLDLKIESSKASSNYSLESWHELRTDFVISSGWLTAEELTNQDGEVIDYDRYDSAEYLTFHLLTEDEKGNIAAGMRLTQVLDPKDMLTRDMLAESPELTLQLDNNIRSKKLREISKRGSLWDITRLISNKDSNISDQINGMLQLFGAGIPVTATDDPDTTWIFTTTEPVLNFLKKSGVQPVDVLVDGPLIDRNGEEERVIVCTVNVQKAITSVLDMMEESRNAKQIARGMDKSCMKITA